MPVREGILARMRGLIRDAAWPPRGAIGIWGWWQGGNLGDNWIRECMAKVFPGARFIDTTVTDLSGFRYVVCGGGGLFVRGVPEPWASGRAPRRFGAIGLGAEFEHSDSRALELSATADFFFVRDQRSLECMHLPPEHASCDITFVGPLPWGEGPRGDRGLLVWRDPRELLGFPDFRRYIGKPAEQEVFRAALETVAEDVTVTCFSCQDNPIRALTEDVGVVVSARYHGVVAAIQRGVPCVAIDVCPKIRQLMRECGLEEYCVKMSQADSVRELLGQVRKDARVVREAQWAYRTRAVETAKAHSEAARSFVRDELGDLWGA